MPTELADQELAKSLVFNPLKLTLNKILRGATLTPDFEVLQNNIPIAYCELKSPRDDFLDELIEKSCPLEIVGGLRNDSIFNRIQRQAIKSAKQFQAINQNRALPNILCYVNHDDLSNFNDLRETFTGFFYANNGARHQTMPHVASRLNIAKNHIDLCIWINSKDKIIEGYLFNQDAYPSYLIQLCYLFGQSPANIQN